MTRQFKNLLDVAQDYAHRINVQEPDTFTEDFVKEVNEIDNYLDLENLFRDNDLEDDLSEILSEYFKWKN